MDRSAELSEGVPPQQKLEHDSQPEPEPEHELRAELQPRPKAAAVSAGGSSSSWLTDLAAPLAGALGRTSGSHPREPEGDAYVGWMRCETGGARSGRWSLLWLALDDLELVISDGAAELARLPRAGLTAKATKRSRKDAPFSFRLDVMETLAGRSQAKYVLEPHPPSEPSKQQWIERLNAAKLKPPPWQRGCELLAYAKADKVALSKGATLVRSGYLWKQGPNPSDGFLRRWFVLLRLDEVPDAAFLLYYSDATARKPKRIIPLPRGGFVVPAAADRDGHNHTWGGRPTYALTLQLLPHVIAAGVALRESYTLAAEHSAGQGTWMAALTSSAEPGTGDAVVSEDASEELRATAALSRGLEVTSSWVMIGEHDNRSTEPTLALPVSWPQLEGRVQGLPAVYRVLRPCAACDPGTARSVMLGAGEVFDVLESRKATGSITTVRTQLGWACTSDQDGTMLMEPVSDASSDLRRVVVTVHRAHSLPGMDLSGRSDPYCQVRLGSEETRTAVVSATNHPRWNETVSFVCPVDAVGRRAAHREKIYFAVWDDDWGEDDFLGSVELDLALLCSSELYRPPLAKTDRMPNEAVDESRLPQVWCGTRWLPLRGVDRGFICLTVSISSLEVTSGADANGWPAGWFSAAMQVLSPADASSVHARIRSCLTGGAPADSLDSPAMADQFGYDVSSEDISKWNESQDFELSLEELALVRWHSFVTHSEAHVMDTKTIVATTTEGQDVVAAADSLHALCTGRLRQLVLSGLPTQRACARHPLLVAWCGSVPLSGLRNHLWLHLSRGAETRAASKLSYASLVEAAAPGAVVGDWLARGQPAAAFEAGRALAPDIARDIPRTSEDLKPDEILALTRMLTSLALAHPVVGYTQGMGFIALLLLRVMEDEEAAFWVFCAVCVDIAALYFVPSMCGLQTDMRVLQVLLAEELPELTAHFAACGYSLEMCLATWLVPLFSNSLPPSVVVRVFDWLFVDGVDVLLAVTVALLRALQPQLLQCTDFGECHNLLAGPDSQRKLPGGGQGTALLRLLSDALDVYSEYSARCKRWRVEATQAVVAETEERNAAQTVRALAQGNGITEEDVKALHVKFMELGIKAKSGRADESRKVETAGQAAAGTVYEARRLDRAGFTVIIAELLPQVTAQMSAAQLETLFSVFDWSGDGEISMEELIATIAIFRGDSTDARLQLCFQLCDADGDGRVSAEELERLFKLCYALFYPSLPREHVAGVVQALLASTVDYSSELGLNFDQFEGVAKRHPFMTDWLNIEALEAEQQRVAAAAEIDASAPGGKAVKEGWIELTRSQANEDWQRRWVTVSDTALTIHAESAASPRHRPTVGVEADIEESHLIATLGVREPSVARLYHPHSLRLALKAAGHTHKIVLDCGSFEQKLEWAMCFHTSGANVAPGLTEAAEVLQMQRRERAAAQAEVNAAFSDDAQADPGGDEAATPATSRRRVRMRTSIFFQSGWLLVLPSEGKRWDQRWCVLSHGLLIVYENKEASTAGTQQEVQRLYIGEECSAITIAPVGGGSDLKRDLISLLMAAEGGQGEVVRLSTGTEGGGDQWLNALKAQAHHLEEDEEDDEQ